MTNVRASGTESKLYTYEVKHAMYVKLIKEMAVISLGLAYWAA